jgi:hypothetical protein
MTVAVAFMFASLKVFKNYLPEQLTPVSASGLPGKPQKV